jgi:hypothetical protein
VTGSALTFLVFLSAVAWLASRPKRPNPSRTPSVTPLRGVWQWLRVLSCRVVSLSRRVAPRVAYGRPEVHEEMPAARVSYDEGRTFGPVAPRAPNLRGPIPAPIEGPDDVIEVAPGVSVSGRGSVQKVSTSTQSARALKQVHPLVPPARPAPVHPKVQLDEWVRRELTDPDDPAHCAWVVKEAVRIFGVSPRTAQRAVRRIVGERAR